jgi:UDP-GlcNAc:undecaprenyl-phosphate/decaprenyl-phosphate GlcNAc-1-phosphate transferase
MSEYVLTLLAAAAVTYILTPLVRRFAVAVGAMHAARERDVHEMPTPLLGGFAIYGGLAAALLVASRLSGLNSVFTGTNMEKGLLLAGGLVVIMGFVDDRWGMGALSKLAGQVAAGVILVWSGAEIPWIPAPGGVTLLLTSDQQIAVTILVVVVTMNAVNFIDGLDGLAAGIVGIGAVAFFAYYFTLTHRLGLLNQTVPALVSVVLAGVCIGFLPHNFYPARIFMGDTGSMLIGLMLAYAPISSLALLAPASLTDTAAYAAGTVNRYGAFIPLLVPAAILLIPYADLLMAVVRRTRAGKSVFAPDKKHLQHRLLAIGHSHRTSVLIMYLWAALFAGSVIWLSIVRTPLFVLAIVTVAAVVALLLVTMPRLRPWSRATAGYSAADVAGRPASPARGPAGADRRAAGTAGWRAGTAPAPEAVRERAGVTAAQDAAAPWGRAGAPAAPEEVTPARRAGAASGATRGGAAGDAASSDAASGDSARIGAAGGGARKRSVGSGAAASGVAGNGAAGNGAAGKRAAGSEAPGNGAGRSKGAGPGRGGRPDHGAPSRGWPGRVVRRPQRRKACMTSPSPGRPPGAHRPGKRPPGKCRTPHCPQKPLAARCLGKPPAGSHPGSLCAAACRGTPLAAARMQRPLVMARSGRLRAAARPGRPLAAARPGRPLAAARPGRPFAVACHGRPLMVDQPGKPCRAARLGKRCATDHPGMPPAAARFGMPPVAGRLGAPLAAARLGRPPTLRRPGEPRVPSPVRTTPTRPARFCHHAGRRHPSPSPRPGRLAGLGTARLRRPGRRSPRHCPEHP